MYNRIFVLNSSAFTSQIKFSQKFLNVLKSEHTGEIQKIRDLNFSITY